MKMVFSVLTSGHDMAKQRTHELEDRLLRNILKWNVKGKKAEEKKKDQNIQILGNFRMYDIQVRNIKRKRRMKNGAQ